MLYLGLYLGKIQLLILSRETFLGRVSWIPTPSSRKVKFQNDPLIMVLIALSRANGPGPKPTPRIILANRKDDYNRYLSQLFGCNYDIFSQFLFNSWLEKIHSFHLYRNVKQQNPCSSKYRREVSSDKIDK